MPRKAATALEKALAFLQKETGKDYSKTLPDPKDRQEAQREAEAVAAFVADPNRFRPKPCGNCEAVFVANYPSVGFCSDHCRKVHLKSLGIQWSPDKSPEERWAPADVPLVIQQHALLALIEAAKQAEGALALHQ